MIPLDVLKDLQTRVTNLEQQAGDTPGADNLQPNVLTVDPDGKIGALLSGGLQIPEQAGAAYVPATALGFLDTAGGGEVREYVLGQSTGGFHFLQLASGADPTDLAQVTARTAALGGAGTALVGVSAQDNTNALATALILDSLGRSSFLQLLASQKLALAFGSSHFVGGGGSPENFTQAHGMGRVPVLAAAFPLGWGPGTIVTIAAPDGVNLNMQAAAIDAIFTNATNYLYYWLAIG